MMNKLHSLHSFRSASTLSRYGLVLLMLFSLVIVKLCVDHDASHLINADAHCALCQSAAIDNHAIPPSSVLFNRIIQPALATQSELIEFYSSTVFVTRSRGPPKIPNS